jgi:hypothetical protein
MALSAIRLGHPGSSFGIVNDRRDLQFKVVRPFRHVLRERRGVVSFYQGPAIPGTRSMPSPDQTSAVSRPLDVFVGFYRPAADK